MTTATTTAEHPTPTKRRPFGPLDAVLLYLLGAIALILVLAAVVPRVAGLTPYVVGSVSMEPTLKRGDLIFVRPVPAGELTEGSLVTYLAGDSVVTHRVWSIEGGTLRTKADASSFLDSSPVEPSQLLGTVAYRLPLLGYVALWLGGEGVSA